jgi:hypothetical protein
MTILFFFLAWMDWIKLIFKDWTILTYMESILLGDVYNCFYTLLDLIANILLMLFASMFTGGYQPVAFSFYNVFDLGIRVMLSS